MENKQESSSQETNLDIENVRTSNRSLSNNQDEKYRLKYYNHIRNNTTPKINKSFLEPDFEPSNYYLQENLFPIKNIITVFNEEDKKKDEIDSESKKTSSLITIFSIWSTMIGSSVLSLPWAIMQAGLIPTFIIVILYGLISYYTCYIYLKTGINDKDFSDTVARYFGKRFSFLGRTVQILASILLNLGAVFIFFIIINQNLFPILAFIINSCGGSINYDEGAKPDFSSFSVIYVAFILAILLFPFIVKKEIDFLIKMNSMGVYFVSTLILYVVFIGFKSFFTTSFDFELKENETGDNVKHLLLFGKDPFKLAGTLTLGFIAHTYVLPILKNNKVQENNARDLFFGYLMVALTFLIVGVLGYVGFSSVDFDAFFRDNWLKFYNPDNIVILILRLFSTFHLCTVLPIITYVVRIQFFGTFYGNPYPSVKHVTIYGVITVVSAVLILYFAYNSLGKLLGIIGATFGFILVYLVPIIINIIYYRRKHPPIEYLNDPSKYEKMNSMEEKTSSEDISKDKELNSNSNNQVNHEAIPNNQDEINEEIDLKDQFIFTGKERRVLKDYSFYVAQYLMMILGCLTMIFQFVDINLFQIHIEK